MLRIFLFAAIVGAGLVNSGIAQAQQPPVFGDLCMTYFTHPWGEIGFGSDPSLKTARDNAVNECEERCKKKREESLEQLRDLVLACRVGNLLGACFPLQTRVNGQDVACKVRECKAKFYIDDNDFYCDVDPENNTLTRDYPPCQRVELSDAYEFKCEAKGQLSMTSVSCPPRIEPHS